MWGGLGDGHVGTAMWGRARGGRACRPSISISTRLLCLLPATCHLLFAVILSEAHFAERRIYAFEPRYQLLCR
jgi:hypothetical protein